MGSLRRGRIDRRAYLREAVPVLIVGLHANCRYLAVDAVLHEFA